MSESIKHSLGNLFNKKIKKYTMEFTNLEILNSLWWMKPFVFCFYKTKFVKNKDKFKEYKTKLYTDLDIVNIIKNLQEVTKSHKIEKIRRLSKII